MYDEADFSVSPAKPFNSAWD